MLAAGLFAAALAPPASAQDEAEAAPKEVVLEEKPPATGLERFIGEWWNGQHWDVFAAGDPEGVVTPPVVVVEPTDAECAAGPSPRSALRRLRLRRVMHRSRWAPERRHFSLRTT
ncbi:MAG: hypothetical protein ACI9MX_002987 [Candidatus Aldehydirespiratoraceae bacterium]|jgi:hypothetical protein